jgi:3-phenylpropionate/trans-cinnamate dioxygenase ferredoxin reductase subunit
VQSAVRSVDRGRRLLTLDDGDELHYDHLVFATGARRPSLSVPGADLPGVFQFREMPSVDWLTRALTVAHRLVVVGGGAVALEIAAVARDRDVDVTVVTEHDRLVEPTLSPRTSEYLLAFHRGRGCRVTVGSAVTRILADDLGRVRGLRTESGQIIGGDLVIVAGAEPRTELAEGCGLEVDGGIVVDGDQATSDPRVFAVGTCCAHRGPGGDVRRLAPGQDAVVQARAVAHRIRDERVSHRVVPSLLSVQGGLRLEIAGWAGAAEPGVVLGDPDAGSYVQLRFHGGVLVGAESVNRPADHAAVRRILASGTTVRRPDLADSADLAGLAQRVA